MPTEISRTIVPTPAQQAWMDLRFGMFVHFSMNTFYQVELGDGKEDPARFDPANFDPEQWADAAVAARMKYAVITTKHHEGFCLWPSKLTEYNILATPMGRDVLREICEAFQSRGIRTGLYYSLWDIHEPSYRDDAAYVDFMIGQLTELLSDYGPVLELWFDGGWVKGHWGWYDATRWGWQRLYDHIKSLQPDCLVLCNPGKMNGGELALSPVDLNCVERVFSRTEDVPYVPDLRPIRRVGEGTFLYLPIETCDSLHPSWYHNPDEMPHDAERIVEWLKVARERVGNLLLNVPPTDAGVIREDGVAVLAEVGQAVWA